MSLRLNLRSFRILSLSLVFGPLAHSCKSTNQNAKALNSEASRGAFKEDQENALVAEYNQSYAALEAEWNRETDGSSASVLALDDRQVKTPNVKPKSFSEISSKLKSVGNHLKFIVSELKNPTSEYHNSLKSRGIESDPVFEKKMITICTEAQTYVAESTRTAASTEAYAKSWGITSLGFLPTQLKAKVDQTYGIVDQWDQQLAAIELAITAKERLSDANESVRLFIGSLSK